MNKKIAASLVIVLLSALLISVPGVTEACTVEVSDGGDIQAAIDAASPGDVICLVNGGIYTPAARIDVTEAVTIKAVDPLSDPLPLINGGGTLERIIYIDSDGVTLDGLEVAYGTGDLIRQSGSYAGTIVRNCVIHDSSGDEGVQLANCTDCLIECCLAFDIAQDGFNMAGGFNSGIVNCEVYNSDSENGAIYVYDSIDMNISCNYIHDNTAHNGIKLYENYGDIVVQNNLIVNNTWDPTNRHVAYSGNGILGYKPVATGYTLFVEHNTISNNTSTIPSAVPSGSGCPAGNFPSDTYGNAIGLAVTSISGTDFDSTVVIEDNILAFNSGWAVITKCYYGYNGPTTCSINYNDAYGNIGGTYSGTCTPGGNNISAVPSFNSDYTLQDGSPCIGAAGDNEDMGRLFDECGCGPAGPFYSCAVFEPPMAMGPVKVKKNRVLPHKAELLDENGIPITDMDIVSPPVIQVMYDSGTAGAVDVTEDALAAGQGMDGNQFEFHDNKWHFNLKTRNYTGVGTYTVIMVSGDESEYVIEPTCVAEFVIE